MKTRILFAALFLSVASAACAAVDSDVADDNGASASAEIREGSALVSTFTIVGTTNDTRFNTLTLKDDHTFTGVGGCRSDLPGPHCDAITSIKGTWKTAKSGPQLGQPGVAPQLAFTDSLDQKTTYFYSLMSDQLALSPVFGGARSVFNRDLRKLPKLDADAICSDKYDNSLGRCPADLPCLADGPGSADHRCLPEL